MTQVTLVALYGEKPIEFAKLVAECQEQIRQVLPVGFVDYKEQQIHATIVGLERHEAPKYMNRNFAIYRKNSEAPMNFAGLINYLRTSGLFPFQVQLGGFQNRDYPFTSRGQNPYERSFSIQGDKVVLMGWPIRGQPQVTMTPSLIDVIRVHLSYPNVLNNLRQAFQHYNVLHAYHRQLTDVDNDFYFRLGLIESVNPLDDSVKKILVERLQEFLGARPPIVIEIKVSDIWVASYEHDTLPLNDSTRVWSIWDDKVTSEFIENLYE